MKGSHYSEFKPSSSVIVTSDVVSILCSFLIYEIVINKYTSLPNLIHDIWNHSYVYLFISFPILLLMLLAVGLYNGRLRVDHSGINRRILMAVCLAYILVKSIYHITLFTEPSNHFIEYNFSTVLIALMFVRFIISKTPYQDLWVKRILILGVGRRASLIEQYMRRKSDRIGIDIVGFVKMKGDAEGSIENNKTIVLDQALESFVVINNIDEVVIACDERRDVLVNDSLFNCRRNGVKIIDIIDFFERETGQIAVNHIYPSWIIYGTSHILDSPLRNTLYWAFNTVIALCIFAVTWPFMLITAIAIKLEDGLNAPVLYSQKRTGLNGKVFSIYKFRSMRIDAEKDGIKWAQQRDPRVTRVGELIRKYRVDELPQLFNVIRGDMDFVGPRPERPEFTKVFVHAIPYYGHRFNVKPGLTGWAQLKYPYGSNENDALEKLKYDLYYIKNRGFLFDILILLRTAEIILFGKGR